MYSVVKYDNGFVEVLRSKFVKKREGYAVAKNYEVKILCENGKTFILQWLETLIFIF